MRNLISAIPAVAIALLYGPFALAAERSPPVPPPCVAANGFEPKCGFARPPEDLEVLPGARALLVSEYGALSGARPGQLSVFDLDTRERRTLFPVPAADNAVTDQPGVGDTQCPGPPGAEFSPHGIHLATVQGKERVLVVNHGGREAIEIFELANGPSSADVGLIWRGCVIASPAVWFNDVVNLPDGGLVATHMVQRGTHEEALVAAQVAGTDTGYALEWHQDQGWQKVAGSEGGLPNGIEISADGATLYINHYLSARVIALDRAHGTRRWEANVAGPDNSSFAPSGELLVASHQVGLETIFACAEHSEVPCDAPYAVIALDPDTGAQRTLFTGEGAPMGAATVAVQIGNTFYLGSFVGERIVMKTLIPASP